MRYVQAAVAGGVSPVDTPTSPARHDEYETLITDRPGGTGSWQRRPLMNILRRRSPGEQASEIGFIPLSAHPGLILLRIPETPRGTPQPGDPHPVGEVL